MNLEKIRRYIHRTLNCAFILILCISVFAPFLLHHHHIYFCCNEPELGYSEEFCPICWFVLQLNTFAFWVIIFTFVLSITIVVRIEKNPLFFSCLSLYLSRAPPLTI
ncbi:MAG: hypothetical protein ACP5UA_03300 [Candidatus Hydrogenedens sp.]